MNQSKSYRHTQRAPLCLILYATVIGMFVLAWQGVGSPIATAVIAIASLVMLVFAASFHHLQVEDEGDVLGIRFGPMPLFSKTIRYDEIQEVQVGKTTFIDGWGIHKSARGGWVWNLWGFDCVTIQHRHTTHVGTDDAHGLADFLNAKTGKQ